ncbi:MAG: T9SS C-terminal target domain-containing protein [Sphingobacteriales bacterium]|nr:MAG: T9SS C-terminal target domain-containing protein [Sphingobacteriales bacterium]
MFDGLYWTPLVKGNTALNNVAVRKLYGGGSSDYIYAMQPANDGGFFIAGSSVSSNSGMLIGITVNGLADMWVMKTDALGTVEWQRLLGGINYDVAYSVSATSDGGCILGGFTDSPSGGIFTGAPGFGFQDGLVIKLTATGGMQWYKVFGGSQIDILLTVQQTTDGGYIACGNSGSGNTGSLLGINSNGYNDGWIIRMDMAGNVLWQKLLGGTSDESLASIVQTLDGGYIAGGESSSSNTGTLQGVTNNGANDAWLIKLDGNGNLQWQKLLGGSLAEKIAGFSGATLKRTMDGGYIVGAHSSSSNSGTLTGLTNHGASSGYFDYWIIKLDGFGNIQWQKLLGGHVHDYCYGIIQTADGGYVATGASASTNSGNLAFYISNGADDAWIIKLDNLGNIQWQKLLGGTGADVIYSVVQINSGFALAGSTTSIGTGYLTGLSGNGGYDGWFFKLDMFGNTY